MIKTHVRCEMVAFLKELSIHGEKQIPVIMIRHKAYCIGE